MSSANTTLIGTTITKIRKAKVSELEAFGWEADCGRHGKPTVIELSDGRVLIASCDPEGNRPGAMGMVAKDEETSNLCGYFVG